MTNISFKQYDVLQISRDDGATWQDFSTLRDQSDFDLARRYVLDPGAWARQDGANAWQTQFRVTRPFEGGTVVATRPLLEAPSIAETMVASWLDWEGCPVEVRELAADCLWDEAALKLAAHFEEHAKALREATQPQPLELDWKIQPHEVEWHER